MAMGGRGGWSVESKVLLYPVSQGFRLPEEPPCGQSPGTLAWENRAWSIYTFDPEVT